jgi:hypothetical protein
MPTIVDAKVGGHGASRLCPPYELASRRFHSFTASAMVLGLPFFSQAMNGTSNLK